MGEIHSIWGGQEIDPATAREENEFQKEVSRLAEIEIPKLTGRLEGMTLDEALETEEDDEESGLDDLNAVEFEGVKTVVDRQIERLVFDAIREHLDRTGVDLSKDQKRALNNYIQLRNSGGLVTKRASLMLAEPTPNLDPRVHELKNRIAEKQSGLLRDALGPDMVGMIDEIESYVAEEWRGEEWQQELEDRTRGIVPSPQNDSQRFLDAAEAVGAVQLGEDEPMDLARTRNLEEARESFKKGDPTSVKGQQNPYLRSAAEIARQGRAEVSEKRALETLRFLDEKIREKIVSIARGSLRSV